MTSCLVLGIVGSLVGFVVWVVVSSRRTQERWRQLARQLGLKVTETSHATAKAEGHFQGYPVCVWNERRKTPYSGDTRAHSSFTLARLSVPTRPQSALTIYPQGLTEAVGKLLGGQDIEVGDPAFDRAFVVRGPDPDTIRRILSAEVRQLALTIRNKASVTVDAGGVVLEREEHFTEARQLHDALTMLVAIARNL